MIFCPFCPIIDSTFIPSLSHGPYIYISVAWTGSFEASAIGSSSSVSELASCLRGWDLFDLLMIDYICCCVYIYDYICIYIVAYQRLGRSGISS